MGVERSVTRWYIQRQMLEHELAQLESQLDQGQAQTEDETAAPASISGENGENSPEELLQKVAMTRVKLKSLGHCPKPMMG
ncbi:hypothetical protein KDH_37480 [Dictyobacter sp. S3.2.2.5]|uniref:Transposase TnpC homeodomain domain-containing protein n=1 Tax=Dictyobacter halimunensis TaxID=3026934 RepID=A0ABQ6FRN2_9CHLR|nr:hypothetical protein KDH_37480 [Dictyobacter sp. S3.2.2.5]